MKKVKDFILPLYRVFHDNFGCKIIVFFYPFEKRLYTM